MLQTLIESPTFIQNASLRCLFLPEYLSVSPTASSGGFHVHEQLQTRPLLHPERHDAAGQQDMGSAAHGLDMVLQLRDDATT